MATAALDRGGMYTPTNTRETIAAKSERRKPNGGQAMRLTSKVKDNNKSNSAFLASSFGKQEKQLSWALVVLSPVCLPVCAVYRTRYTLCHPGVSYFLAVLSLSTPSPVAIFT